MMLRKKLSSTLVIIRNVLLILVIVLFMFIYHSKRVHQETVLTKVPKSAQKYIEFRAQNEMKTLPISTIKSWIAKYNSDLRVLNMDYFGPLKPETPVFVIFVDKYRNNLNYLLASMAQVLGIEDSLIIFSHSSYDENVNNLIKTIDFARVLQIFYPYSIQIYPHEFPGFQEGDCPHNMDMITAQSINCTGAYTPDIHGRYRIPLQAQMKNYWWWTMNKIFENLPLVKNHEGIFTFLDDDVFLMEDFFFMTVQMKKICRFITECEFISLAAPKFETTYLDTNTFSVTISTWDPKDYPSVISFDASVWSSIAAHYYLFCYIDDSSWARSLFYLSLNRKDGGRFKVMSSTLPRAFKTTSFTLYEKYLEYDMMHIIYKVLNIQEKNKDNLYPVHLDVYFHIELDEDDFVIFDYVDNNGGWNDPRDKNMCYNITTNKIKKVIMEMAQEFHQYDIAQSM